MSRAKYIMKVDAHCSFDEGFDVKLMEDSPYDWTIVPRMYNLHAFNWKCNACRHERYQGPTPEKCEKCENTTDFERVIYWREKRNPTSDHMRFDSDLHFQYWTDFKKRPEAKADLAPTMSLIGACWFMHRERYWELDGMDERHGSWGQMGTEIACKSWLSGGACCAPCSRRIPGPPCSPSSALTTPCPRRAAGAGVVVVAAAPTSLPRPAARAAVTCGAPVRRSRQPRFPAGPLAHLAHSTLARGEPGRACPRPQG